MVFATTHKNISILSKAFLFQIQIKKDLVLMTDIDSWNLTKIHCNMFSNSRSSKWLFLKVENSHYSSLFLDVFVSNQLSMKKDELVQQAVTALFSITVVWCKGKILSRKVSQFLFFEWCAVLCIFALLAIVLTFSFIFRAGTNCTYFHMKYDSSCFMMRRCVVFEKTCLCC
jgi:hypothetical protein